MVPAPEKGATSCSIILSSAGPSPTPSAPPPLWDGRGSRLIFFRTPRQIAGEGCSHCVKIRLHDLEDALAVLRQAGLPAKRVFLADNGGGYEEVGL